MNGKTAKRLRRIALEKTRNANYTMIAVNQVTGEMKPINLYKKLKEMHHGRSIVRVRPQDVEPFGRER